MALYDFCKIEDIMPIDYDMLNEMHKKSNEKHIKKHGGLLMLNCKPIKSIFELWEWQKNNSEE